MSAIAGLYYPSTPKPVDPGRIAAMADAQAHRGPDGAGVWTAPGVGLGHRRLAIIDVAGSPQPMQSADGALSITFDGAIYNFAALRAELQAQGAVFVTAGDTEVLLHAWAAWGPAMLDRLNGLFAFALHDARRHCLFLARDRLGEKPLCYAQLADGAVAFASELKGLLAHPLLRRVPDVRAIDAYLAFGYVPDDVCLVAGVRKLPAGHALLIARGKGVSTPTHWWSLDFSRRARGSAKALAADLITLLRDAVTARMVSDVPLGAFLSGDVNSAAVVALMAEASRGPVRTYTVGFDASDLDGRGHAKAIARRFATRHRDRIVALDDPSDIDQLARAFDEPFADASALAGYRMCQWAGEDVRVALSDDSAAEAFADHPRHAMLAAEQRVRGLLPAALRTPVFGTLGRLYPTLLPLALDEAEAHARSVTVTAPAVRAALFSAAARREMDGYRAEDRYLQTFRDAPARDALDRAYYAALRYALPGGLLARLDRTSMALGLELRTPLLDHRLIAFLATLPAALWLRGGQGGWLLKKALARYLPPDTIARPSTVIASPVDAWFRGRLAGESAALASSRVLIGTGWFEPATIVRLAEDHRAGRAEHGSILWQLVMLERSMTRIFG